MVIYYGACAVDDRIQILCDVLKFDYHSISGKQRLILSHRQSTPFNEWKKQQCNHLFLRSIKSSIIRIKGYWQKLRLMRQKIYQAERDQRDQQHDVVCRKDENEVSRDFITTIESLKVLYRLWLGRLIFSSYWPRLFFPFINPWCSTNCSNVKGWK